jgi:hypothetical protein
LLVDRLCSIEGIGIEQFHDLARSLDAAQCRMAIGALAAEDKEGEPFEDVWQRELVWGARALGWSGRLCTLIGQDRQRMRELCEAVSKRVRAELRIAEAVAKCDLALKLIPQGHTLRDNVDSCRALALAKLSESAGTPLV